MICVVDACLAVGSCEVSGQASVLPRLHCEKEVSRPPPDNAESAGVAGMQN